MTDYKQLCAELVDIWDATADFDYKDFGQAVANIVVRASASLTEPEPEEPTDTEILETLKAQIVAFPPQHPEALSLSAVEYEVELEIRKARAVLARWRNHPGSPDSSAQPIPVSERLPGPEDCDAKGRCWAWKLDDEDDAWHLELKEWINSPWTTHWLPANALPQPS